MQSTKPIWNSVTFWINIVALVVSILGGVFMVPVFDALTPYFGIALSIINIILRAFVKKRIRFF